MGVEILRQGNSFTVYALAPFFYLFSGNKFDVVVDEIHGIPFFTPLFVGVPKIVLIHEVAGQIWDYMFPTPFNYIGKFAESLYFKLYSKIKFWVPSNSTREELLGMGIRSTKINLIYCAINNGAVSVPPRKEKVPTFIFVSRVVPMKGIEEVIKAFFFILKDLKDGYLWIVGNGDKKYLEKLNRTMLTYAISPKVKFFGQVSNSKKLELMRRAHLLLHASVKEGWGLVVIEAASQGTPSVVYNVAGLRDSVLNGKTGDVLKKNSPKVMAEEAIDLISSKKKYLSYQANGIKWAKSLKWEKFTKQSLKLLEDATKNK